MNFIRKKKSKSILNGWIIELISNNKIINVSQKIRPYINNAKILEIKKSFYTKEITAHNESFYWKITNKYNKKWMPITILGGMPFSLDLNTNFEERPIKIVYFINSDISNCYLNLMKDQINDFFKSKIFKYKKIKLFFIIISSSLNRRREIENLLLLKNIKEYVDYEITFSKDNHKEYEGINKVWQLSQIDRNKNDLIIYLHAKGISYMQNKFFYIRQPLEKFIFKLLIGNWEKNLELINRFNSIQKLGILSGGNGWLWFNFWIAKSSYISQLEKPLKRKRACYYEDWLGRDLINSKKIFLGKYKNEYGEIFSNNIDKNLNLLSNISKKKYNIGTPCKVEKGGFVGLGFVKIKYRIWYLFFVVLNKLKINKGEKSRFKFY